MKLNASKWVLPMPLSSKAFQVGTADTTIHNSGFGTVYTRCRRQTLRCATMRVLHHLFRLSSLSAEQFTIRVFEDFYASVEAD